MPPKFKFTREQIVAAALEVTRKNGITGLTARGLAAELGSSAKPIFGLFQNMEEVQREVVSAANTLYQSYIKKGMADNKFPPYKASGIAYIQFAKEEKELFKLLFMRDRTDEKIEENREEIRPILDLIMKNLGIDENEAYFFHLELWLYVHGIATMIATNYLEWDIEFIDKALTDAYQGLKNRYVTRSTDNE
ncbi:MAG TPA: WHG domain-containing protein [Candidatus Mediterraneibacter caccogallinarum]|jgi:AcrR family transcriptional regulator|nr:WHG domain-containing protein [Candidatus Mediterraneibacter caccogallinarum]